jgi:diguanylate cyclase
MTATVAKKQLAFGDATEAARKTLRLLASKRVAPTPDNYRQIYCEIVGEPEAEAPLEQNLQWSHLLAELVRQWEIRHAGWTPARKRERLERLLAIGSPNQAVLFNRIKALVHSWSTAPVTGGSTDLDPTGNESPAGQSPHVVQIAQAARHEAEKPETANRSGAGSVEPAASLREWLAHAMETVISARLAGNEALGSEARALAARIRKVGSDQDLPLLSEDLRRFWAKVDRLARDDKGLRDGVLRLLRLLVDNITELVVDDRWLHGQMDVVRRVLTDPSDIQLIEDAERSIKAVITKQGMIKTGLNDAKSTIKDMVTRFIDQLGAMSQSTGAYQDKLDHYSTVIRDTDDISELSSVLDDLMRETRQIQDETARSRENIIAVRERAEAAEQKVRQLEAELVQASELVREDQLTGVLNRRGLDDAFERELSRAERSGSLLCIALLDLDNFKRLNDTHGHQAGDRALVHMIELVKSTVRPHDIIARYGGEEFLILLPDTGVEEAESVIVRLQRNLTKHFFLHNNERLLITFSAGVALHQCGESRELLVERADMALYQAKKTGKNRVVRADGDKALPSAELKGDSAC